MRVYACKEEDLEVQAHKVKVTIPEDHQLEIRLPEDFPSGPAEVIVLAARPVETESRKSIRAALSELRELERTPEEEQILEDFEKFRQVHPFTLSSLAGEE